LLRKQQGKDEKEKKKRKRIMEEWWEGKGEKEGIKEGNSLPGE
jgi:hypothetical protein